MDPYSNGFGMIRQKIKKYHVLLPSQVKPESTNGKLEGVQRFVVKRIQGVHLGNNPGIIIPGNPNHRKTKQKTKENQTKTKPTHQPPNQTNRNRKSVQPKSR